ncbi:5-hydroxytryptamine receptor 3C-like [Takifugu rubripes]|uniref:5-hydroxytryptamine receptor 3C-like n=1 Tax=Takifugu rubripes TaxID=31033 RepID=UPI0005D20E15|nr:5-hydroxytryptamine receptor 3C-like [Takifugu rubripes]|eukprot:XP_003974288.2 PREDICTED: 5-hydroxytryptamine receptor 3C-like isoform X1 [Takifugu rubripes]
MKSAGILIIIWVSLHNGFVWTLNCSNPTPEALFNALEKDLFSKKLHRPVKSINSPLRVNVDMTVVAILSVHEKEQSLTTFLWQVLEWDIYGLSWDAKECGTHRVSVPREELWIPDIHITQFMDEDKSPQTPYVYLYNTGHVYNDSPLRVASTCKLGIYSFPFDIQNCSLTFGSYIHFDTDIMMVPSTTSAEILEESKLVAQTDGEWELSDIEVVPATLEIADGKYSQIIYHLILRRRPILYVINLILPSIFLVTLDVFSFLLPPHSVDRSAFKMTLILGYTVFLLLMNDLLPVTGNETPLLNVFFSLSFALMVASLLATLFVTNLYYRSSHFGPVPHWLHTLMLKYAVILVCLPPNKRTNRITVSLPEYTKDAPTVICSRDLQSLSTEPPSVIPHDDAILTELKKLAKDLSAIRLQLDSHFQESKSSQEWKMISAVIDRLIFGLYIVFICISVTIILVIWHFSRYSSL